MYSNNKYLKDQPNDAWFKIFQFIKPNSTILDIGCSSGKLGAALKKEKKVHVIGVDIDKDDVELAKKNLDDASLLNIEKDDPSHLGKFDYIIMADVIEHLVDPVGALKKVTELLNKNGKLVFSIPNMANVTTRIELLKGKFEYKDFGLLDRTHLHFYDHKEVNRVFDAAGFVVETTDCTMREIPEKLLSKELSEIGVELTPKFHKHLLETEALVYQFIGVASPGKTPKKMPLLTKTPLDIISIEIDRLRDEQTKELEVKNKEAEVLNKKVKELEETTHTLDNRLSEILNSKGWKMLNRVYKAKGKLTRNR